MPEEVKPDFKIRALSERDADEIPVSYIKIFTEHPWHQEYECAWGKGPYSFGCKSEGDKC